jgi:NADH dehydrogenase
MLEPADVENENKQLRRSLITFVVVGGGFSGVETVGELNDFVPESIRHYYDKDAKIILVNSGRRILPEVTEDLAEFALQKLRKDGIEVILNTRLVGAERNEVNLSDGVTIS